MMLDNELLEEMRKENEELKIKKEKQIEEQRYKEMHKLYLEFEEKFKEVYKEKGQYKKKFTVKLHLKYHDYEHLDYGHAYMAIVNQYLEKPLSKNHRIVGFKEIGSIYDVSYSIKFG